MQPQGTNNIDQGPEFSGNNSNNPLLKNFVQKPVTPTSIIGNGQIGPLAPQPASKPTSVVSSNTAANHATGTVQNTLDTAKTNQTNYNTTQQNSAASLSDATQNAGTDQQWITQTRYDGYGQPYIVRIPNPNYKVTPPGTPSTTDQATTDAQNAVAHPNQTQLYNLTNGQQEWVDNTTLINGNKTGYSSTNPTTMGATNVVQGQNGETYKQFADGTYGMFDAAGNYVTAANSAQFQSAQRVQDANTAFDNLNKGILTPNQQNQIDSIKQQYADLINKQTQANANLTGGTTVAQNMYGIGNTTIASGQIKQTVDDGIKKISTLTNQMNDAISKMTQAFQSDDIDLLKTAYDTYNTSQQAVQKQLDQIQTSMQKEADKITTANISINESMAKKYSDVDSTTYPGGITPDMTPEERQAALQTSPSYLQATALKPQLTDDENNWYADFESTGAAKYLSLPGGRSAAGIAQNTPILKAMIAKAVAAGVSGSQFGAALSDKTAAKSALDLMTKQGANLQAQEDKVTQDIAQLKQKASAVSDKDWQSNIPMLQKYIQGIDVNWAPGSSQSYIDYAGLLKTTMTSYARVINSQTGSAGTSVNINDEIQSLIPPGSNPKIAINYLENTAIPEMKHTTDSYKNTQEDLSNTIGNAIGTQNFGAQGSNLSTTNVFSGTGETSSTSGGDYADTW